MHMGKKEHYIANVYPHKIIMSIEIFKSFIFLISFLEFQMMVKTVKEILGKIEL